MDTTLYFIRFFGYDESIVQTVISANNLYDIPSIIHTWHQWKTSKRIEIGQDQYVLYIEQKGE